MDTITFDRRYKHGRLDFHPGPKYGFEDPDAAPYFKALGIATDTTGEPDVTVSLGECDIDPLTVWGNGERRGAYVMPERAAEARGITLEEAQAYRADESELVTHG